MLGISIRTAVSWQKAASGDWMAYAAAVSRRPPAAQARSIIRTGSNVARRAPAKRPKERQTALL
jgi:hypothetical protein